MSVRWQEVMSRLDHKIELKGVGGRGRRFKMMGAKSGLQI